MSSSAGRRRERAEQPFWTERSFVLSAFFVAGILVMAGLVLVTRSADEPAGPRVPAGQVALTDCPPVPAAPPGPARPPEDATWRTLEAGHVIPLSVTEGPTRTEGGVLRCFARSPMGAVLAAYTIPVLLHGPQWRAVLDRQVVAGQGQEILAARLEMLADGPVRRVDGRYEGFAVDRYSPEAATVQLLVRGSTGGYSASRIELRWDGADWRLQPSAVGQLYQPVGEVLGSAGYTLWRP
ncbi:hypothetical protein AWW66_27000 [Micromonospora rosaria]|uniref:DUF8175 domain-containing protein n=1 Tax=Micromonospora rosaria TaxID=47874 RepID=A0A136PKN5_9ACTN|nr:hypothetical protein [Micromonospora rosaria]KXK58938.1 hypothetical protein AWW66_27000 [Micromonospora rosaria]